MGLNLRIPILEDRSKLLVSLRVVKMHRAIFSTNSKSKATAEIVRASETVSDVILLPNDRMDFISIVVEVLNIPI